MKLLSKYLVEQLKSVQKQKSYDKKNRLYHIDLNDFFKYSGNIEINNRFVSACRLPQPSFERVIINNDMSKYKLNKTLTEEYINRYERNKTKA
tara:strand:+ start:9947 stop:10225 length:279 start_codon:yes stop_codon:yes gene_type:complete